MHRLKDLSIRVKLLGGFAVVLAVSAVMGIVLLSQLASVNSGGVYLGTKALRSDATINMIARDAVDYRRAQLKYVLDPKTPAGAQAKRDWTKDASDIQAQLQHKQQAGFTVDADRTFWQTAGQQWSALTTQTADLTRLATADATPQARGLVDASLPTFKALMATLNTWTAANEKWAAQKLASNNSAYSSAQTLGIALIVLALVLGAGVALLLSRSIKR